MPPTDAEVLQSVNVNKPKPNPRNNPTMFQIFQNVQYNIVQHKKYAKEMTKLYKKMEESAFRESFKNALMYLFTFGDTSANVDRVVKFVATFCTTLDDEEEFLLFIINIVFDCQCVSGQSVRYRASQLLEAVLSALGEDASLDEDLCNKLLQSQMQRLQDTRGAVRCRAALALQRLQDPMDPADEVTRAYRFHMSCDPSASVRRAIVTQIAKCTRNVPFVLERLCDVDEAVRRAAFMYIAAVNVTQLRVRQRVLTLKVGLSERSPRVRRVVEEILIPGWLSTFKGNIVDLLKAIRLDNAHDAKDSQYVAGKLLESLFKRLPISELLIWLPTEKSLRLIPAEKLNKETAWYWRHLAEHLQKIDDDETLELVLPDLVVLIGYIRAIVESPCPSEADEPVAFSTRQYVLHELGCMLRVYDTDPPGRAALQALITDVLTGDYGHMSADVIRPLVSALELVFPELSPRMEVVCGMISALRDPPEPEAAVQIAQPDSAEVKMKRARLRVSLNVAMEAQEEAVREQNYALAAECKAKVADIQKQLEDLVSQAAPPPPPVPTIREKISDAETLTKCLTILNAALDTPQLQTVTPMLQTIFNELEVVIFQNPEILEPALETVALYGMLDKNFAKDNKAFFFANLIDTSNEQVVITVLRCLVDLLCVHGVRVFEDEESQNESKNQSKNRRKTYLDAIDEDGSISESILSLSPAHSTVIELLLKIMDSPCASYRLIIVEGLCRLLHLGQIESPSILSRLLLLWFNPATVDEDMLRQTIGVFFETFPMNVDGAQEQIQKATLPTLRTLANAPSSSPLSEIDQEAVVKFIASLTRVNHELTDSQGSMAMLLCSYLVRRPSASEVALACRLLALLSPPRDARLGTELAAMLRDLCLKLPDKQSTRNLTRYLGAIEAAERMSMNKMSNTGVTDGTTLHPDDTFAHMGGRITTSLPTTQPLARSTHVVVNQTMEVEVEIHERHMENISKIDEETPQEAEAASMAEDNSPDSIPDTQPETQAEGVESDSSGVSPVKKAKVAKGKKKKLSITRQGSGSDTMKAKGKGKDAKETSSEDTTKDKGKDKEKNAEETSEESEKGGIKRSRSQRSVVDVDRAQKTKASKSKKAPSKSPSPPKSPNLPSEDIDTSNITIRKSSRGLASSSSTDSDGTDNVGNKKSNENVPATKLRGKKANSKEDAKKEKGGKKTVTKTPSKPQTRPSTSPRSSRERRGSTGSFQLLEDDSADETELRTIVYDNELQQSLLNDTSELADSRRDSKGEVTIPGTPEDTAKAKGKDNKKNAEETSEGSEKGGIKRSRSQRSVVEVKRAQTSKASKSKKALPKSPSPPPKSPTAPSEDIDSSNITIRKSSRGLASSSSTDSDGTDNVGNKKSNENVPATKGRWKKSSSKEDAKKEKGGKKTVTKTPSKPQTRPSTSPRSSRGRRGSTGSFQILEDDSADETELRTIVYDNELQQSLLIDTSELADSRRDSKSEVTIPGTPEDTAKAKGKDNKKNVEETSEESEKGGVKRSRSQRSVVNVKRAQKHKASKSKKALPKSPSPPPKSPNLSLEDIDTSNITIRNSPRGLPSSSSTDSDRTDKVGNKKSNENVPATKGRGKKANNKEDAKKEKGGKKKTVNKTSSKPLTRSSTSSRGSRGSRGSTGSFQLLEDNSADETELHTIVYDNELVQSLLNDSSELADSRRDSKGNVTIPETPEGSDMSDSEPEVITKPKGKRK